MYTPKKLMVNKYRKKLKIFFLTFFFFCLTLVFSLKAKSLDKIYGFFKMQNICRKFVPRKWIRAFFSIRKSVYLKKKKNNHRCKIN